MSKIIDAMEKAKSMRKLQGEHVMEDKRACYRIPAQEKADFCIYTAPVSNALFITDFSRTGLGFGLPYQCNIKQGDELDLIVKLIPLKKPMIITGTVMWTKFSDCYRDYAIAGGIKFKDTNSEEKWTYIVILLMINGMKSLMGLMAKSYLSP